MPVKIDDNMELVLDVFQRENRVTTGYLVDETGLTRPTVTKRLDRLYAAGHVRYVHEPTALWELIEDPRREDP